MLKTPKFVSCLLPDIVWEGNTSLPEIFLTFDDGPHPIWTYEILRVLQEFRVKASFFVIGSRAAKHPKLVQEIKSRGHLIGNHSYNHQRFFLRSKSYLRREIAATEEIIERIAGERTKFFRPPYGRFDFLLLRISRELGYRVVMWGVMPGDYQGSFAVEELVKRTVNNTRPGVIIVLHDCYSSTAKALPQILESLIQEYDFHCIDKITNN